MPLNIVIRTHNLLAVYRSAVRTVIMCAEGSLACTVAWIVYSSSLFELLSLGRQKFDLVSMTAYRKNGFFLIAYHLCLRRFILPIVRSYNGCLNDLRIDLDPNERSIFHALVWC